MLYGKIPDFDEACEPLSALTDALWPSDAKLWVPPFPVATHALSNAVGNVRVVDRGSGRADNPSVPAVVLIEGTAEWHLDHDRVAPPADEQDDSPVAGLQIIAGARDPSRVRKGPPMATHGHNAESD